MGEKIDNSDYNLFVEMLNDLYGASKKTLQFDQPIKIKMIKDQHNFLNPLGKTASYNPDTNEICLYFMGRHPKDLMRSFSHELVHHAQNCRGELTEQGVAGEGYAQVNPHLREMEREAYEMGNMIFRDWEDNTKKSGVVPLFNNSPFATIQMGYKENLGENKMSKEKLQESHLRDIIRGVIKEMFDDDLVEEAGSGECSEDNPTPCDQGFASERAAQAQASEPYETGVTIGEDSGEQEKKNYRRNREEDERRVAGLEKDIEFDKRHEPLEEDELNESFLPQARNIRSDARVQTYNKLLQKWCK